MSKDAPASVSVPASAPGRQVPRASIRSDTVATGGAIRPAGHVKLPMDTSLYNLWVTLLEACEVPVRQFGNSTGGIDAIRC